MANHSVAVLSGNPELLMHLRNACPDLIFEGTEPTASQVAVIDSDSIGMSPRETPFVTRILLEDGGGTPRTGRGDISIARSYFLDHPREILSIAFDFLESETSAEAAQTELRLLEEIQQLIRLGSLEMVSEKIARTVLGLLGLSRATLLMHDPKVERYVISFSTEPAGPETAEFLPHVPPALLQEALNSPDFFAVSPAGETGRQLLIPLKIDDDVIGVLTAELTENEEFTPESAAIAARYTSRISAALGNINQLTQSRELAMCDDLTKAFNRRFFESYLDEESERSRRYGTIFSIIFLDLDDLKLVNNRYGHLTGSRMLQEVAKRILGAVRGIDKVVRFGGDEFCIILPQTDQVQSHAVAERVRRAITGDPFRLEQDVTIQITASFGIATYPIHAVTKEDLIHQADAAMYRVKSTTKNAIQIASTPSPSVVPQQMTQ